MYRGYCQLKSNLADFLLRTCNLNAEKSMSYKFEYCLIFGHIHLTGQYLLYSQPEVISMSQNLRLADRFWRNLVLETLVVGTYRCRPLTETCILVTSIGATLAA